MRDDTRCQDAQIFKNHSFEKKKKKKKTANIFV
jgi:hypothetical protein